MNKKLKMLIILLVLIIPLIMIFIINHNKNKVNVSGGILQEGIIPGYTEEQIKEILQRDFYQELNQIEFTDFEYEFINLFNEEIINLQQRQHTHDIFLKKRLDIVSPQLTLPGLHKYLKKDQKSIDIKLSPRELYQNAVCYFILNNQNLSDTQLIQQLRLEDLTSLNYYRQKSYSTTE